MHLTNSLPLKQAFAKKWPSALVYTAESMLNKQASHSARERYGEASKRLGKILGEKVKMTHSDCASAGQCKLDGVEKSNRAVGFIPKYKSMLFSCVVVCIVLKDGCTVSFIQEFTMNMKIGIMELPLYVA